MINSDIIETEELNEKADKVEKSENVATIIKQNEEKVRTKKKNICIAYRQQKVFGRFNEREKFIKLHKNTIIFKINIDKLIDKYPKLMMSSVTLGF